MKIIQYDVCIYMTIIVVADRESTQPQWTEALRTNPNPAAESGKYLIRYLINRYMLLEEEQTMSEHF